MFQGKFQIYGSQFNYDTKGNIHIYPILNEPYVNERRKSVGLPPMEQYCKIINQYANKNLTYTITKTDKYKNKIVVEGSVLSKENNMPLEKVSICFSNNQSTGKSDSGDFFQIVVERKLINQEIVFKKQGFQTIKLTLKDEGKDVYELKFVLIKE